MGSILWPTSACPCRWASGQFMRSAEQACSPSTEFCAQLICSLNMPEHSRKSLSSAAAGSAVLCRCRRGAESNAASRAAAPGEGLGSSARLCSLGWPAARLVCSVCLPSYQLQRRAAGPACHTIVLSTPSCAQAAALRQQQLALQQQLAEAALEKRVRKVRAMAVCILSAWLIVASAGYGVSMLSHRPACRQRETTLHIFQVPSIATTKSYWQSSAVSRCFSYPAVS